MLLRMLGTSNIAISPIIMGTWQAGQQHWVGVEDKAMTRAIEVAVDCGINAFDTAEEYGEGHSERILGAAVRRMRHEVMLMSKVFSNHLYYDQVIQACHQSLQNLKTDYIDLYQIHWPSGCWESEVVPIAETMQALIDLKQQGKIRAIGVSNFSHNELIAVSECGGIESVQPPYSLFWRHIETAIQPWCVENKVSILGYSSLAQGILTGKFARDHQFAEGDHRSANKLYQPAHWDRVQTALAALRDIAKEKGVALSQLALAWLIAQPQTYAIAGARHETQVKSNAIAMGLALSADELIEMDRIGRVVSDPFIDDPVPWTWQP